MYTILIHTTDAVVVCYGCEFYSSATIYCLYQKTVLRINKFTCIRDACKAVL